jgi:hypothetical protein
LIRFVHIVAGKSRNIILIKEMWMKKMLVALVVVLALCLSFASPALAGGDQVRGDNGQGAVNQNFTTDNPPFEP